MSDNFEPEGVRGNPRIVPTSGEAKGTGIRYLVMGGAIAALGIFAGFLWYAYSQSSEKTNGMMPPTIKAEMGPTKVRPETPGGMDVPHQDKTVYNRVDNGGNEGQTEKLLPPSEKLMDKPREPDIKLLSDLFGDKAPTAPPIPGMKDTESPVVVDLLPARPEKAKMPPIKAKADAKQIPITAQDSASGKFLIQVGAFRDRAGADAGWARMRKRHGKLLSGLEPDIARADLGAKGVFYRLRAGPLGDKSSADRLCSSLKELKVGCLVVKP